ncbi:hypothetical protein DV736_g6280, partial [Chaetothyriales sp. CBS 134916]
MFRAWLQRAAFSQPPTAFLRHGRSRFASQQATKSDPTSKPARLDKIRQKLDWWIAKSPRVFRPTLRVIRDAPASYTISFLILHELTAIIPLAGLTLGFHYFRWLPSYFAEGKWAVMSVEKLGRGQEAVRWLIEVATAYTIVKALMPLRLLVSAWAAPAFATWTLIPLRNAVRGSRQTKSLK